MERAVQPARDNGVTMIKLMGSDGTKEFPGRQLGKPISTREEGKHKWLEMTCYRGTVSDPTGDGEIDAYVLYVVGKSLIYHRVGDPCNMGVTMEIENLPFDAESCEICKPPDYDSEVEDTYPIAMEIDWPSIIVCPTPEDLINELRKRSRRRDGDLSGPAKRLLASVREHDEDVRSFMTRTTRL